MKLSTNTFIDGAWYGPDYGDEDLPPEVEAKIGQPTRDIAITNNVVTVRTMLISGFTRIVEEKVIPKFAQLPLDEQAAALEEIDDFDAFVDSVAGRLAAAPEPVDEAPAVMADEDVIVLAEGREYFRGDLVALLDLLDETAVADQAADHSPPPPDPDPATSAITEADPPAPAVPTGSVDELLAWVYGTEGEPYAEGWQSRAQAVLAAEQADPPPRKTLVEPLERALEQDANEVT